MKRLASLPFVSRALVGTLAVVASACSDDVTAPAVQGPASLNEAAAPVSLGLDRHFVMFRNQNKVPGDFEARVAALGGTVEGAFDAVGVALVGGLSADAAAQVSGWGDVASMEQDESFRTEFIRYDGEVGADAAADAPEAALAAAATPLATPAKARYFGRQWNMRAIGADKAWAAGLTGAGVRVAILDTGIDPTHPDLAGLVDASRSASFVTRDDTIAARWFPGRNLPRFIDMNGHGTHVASAVASRGLYTAGVTSEVSLMAVKVLGAVNGNEGASVFRGLLYAVENGADVVNMSLGGGFSRAGAGGVGAIHRVINYAHRRGVTIVVAAGNAGADLQHNGNAYNTYCDAPNVICVAATGPVDGGAGGFINDPAAYTGPFSDVDVPSAFTNYGTNAINVAAPGGNYRIGPDPKTGNPVLLSAAYVWQACSKFGLNARTNPATGFETVIGKNVCAANPSFHLPNGYVGTSQAAPHVAGLAALLVQKHGRNPAIIRAKIQQSADDIAGGGSSPFYGKGRINVASALGL